MPELTIMITGHPAWAAALHTALGGARLLHDAERPADLIARLVDDAVDLIVVDGADADWREWTTAPKRSPATRRIPVVLVTTDPAIRADAPSFGADATLTPDEVATRLPALIYEQVSLPRALQQARLECDCAADLPPLALAGVEKFNAGDYYAQHDLFESLWMQTESPVRDLYRAILQVGVAYYQIERGNGRGALKMLLRSRQWLSALPDVCQGVDVRGLREDSAQVRAELERLLPDRLSAFDRSLFKPLRRV
jgi:predicted metal-dependent hydrolase